MIIPAWRAVCINIARARGVHGVTNPVNGPNDSLLRMTTGALRLTESSDTPRRDSDNRPGFKA
jgi:hypothetical protein